MFFESALFWWNVVNYCDYYDFSIITSKINLCIIIFTKTYVLFWMALLFLFRKRPQLAFFCPIDNRCLPVGVWFWLSKDVLINFKCDFQNQKCPIFGLNIMLLVQDLTKLCSVSKRGCFSELFGKLLTISFTHWIDIP